MTFAEINKARARPKKDLSHEYIAAVRDRRVLTQERNDLALLLLCVHHQGTGTGDAHGRPAAIRLERGSERLDFRIKWGSDGVPRIGPKTREALQAWFARVPFPRTIP